ncbi:MAG: UDP-N-acetylmuramate--L-alanine ligase [Candidatus Doudnabacteria bacterium]
MNLEDIKKIHFVGIGGIGMSAVAGLAKEKGFEVSGSDVGIYDPAKSVLDKYSIQYSREFKEQNVEGADLIITTSAVDPLTNPEVKKALAEGTPVKSFAELLAEFVKDKKKIMVVGTHGKGTTSGLIAFALKILTDSSFFVGGVLTNLNTNFHFGKGPYFVLEGDEYKANFDDNRAKFLFFKPDVLLINNIEYDHPDLYPDIESYKKAFQSLAESLPEESLIIYNVDDKNVQDVIVNSQAKKVAFSISNVDSKYSTNVSSNTGNGLFNFMIKTAHQSYEFNTKLPGLVYTYDNLAAISVLLELGVDHIALADLVAQYSGIKRRYEILCEGDFVIVDDYAHHPTAVRQTLEATKAKYPQRRIVCFFEPHTYSRTLETLPELKNSFNSADLVYLAEVYPAREQKLPSSITGEEVVQSVKENHDNVFYVKDKSDAQMQYAAEAKTGDVIVVMAVGSFNTLAYDLKNKYQNN